MFPILVLLEVLGGSSFLTCKISVILTLQGRDYFINTVYLL